MNISLSNEERNLIARSWVRYQSGSQPSYLSGNRTPEPDYKKVLSLDGDIWPYEDSPFDVLYDLNYDAPDIAYDIVLRIAEITDDERLLAYLAAGPLEALISHHDEAEKYLTKFKKLVATSAKHKHLLSMVWF